MAKLEPSFFLQKNGREIVFKSLAPEDAENFLKFREQVAHESTHTMHYVGMELPGVAEAAKRLAIQQGDKAGINIAAFDGDKVVAYLNFRLPWSEHPWVQHVGQFGMMVLKEYWGQGIGMRLLDLQDTYARSIGVSRLEAMVRVKNDRGIQLYLRNGYKIEGTREKAARINGEFHDEYFIAKIL
ncbi:MAG: GNAT family N-acetyltransferase [Bdellovibrionales bacterium]|nr:GNAT family N-acetyltransferase [Bdellovibrionales bacterium]